MLGKILLGPLLLLFMACANETESTLAEVSSTTTTGSQIVTTEEERLDQLQNELSQIQATLRLLQAEVRLLQSGTDTQRQWSTVEDCIADVKLYVPEEILLIGDDVPEAFTTAGSASTRQFARVCEEEIWFQGLPEDVRHAVEKWRASITLVRRTEALHR